MSETGSAGGVIQPVARWSRRRTLAVAGCVALLGGSVAWFGLRETVAICGAAWAFSFLGGVVVKGVGKVHPLDDDQRVSITSAVAFVGGLVGAVVASQLGG